MKFHKLFHFLNIIRRALQQHKLQRSSIKIQLYCENASGSSRDLIGYVLLDLRSAGESAKEVRLLKQSVNILYTL